MTLGMYNYVTGMIAHTNPCTAAIVRVMSVNM